MIYKEKIFEEIVNKYFDTGIIKKGDTLIIALSGGMDSMCLLDAFYKLMSEVKYNLIAVHVHHGIRDEEADRDLKFVEGYCKSLNIKFIKTFVKAKEYAKKNYLTLEEAARKLRYAELEKIYKIQKKKSAKHDVYVLVAHHMKDQAETVIHNIVRGTGIKGLSAMNSRSDYILRPILYIDKTDIEKYIDSYAIPFVKDSTNDDTQYTRNYIRKEIIDRCLDINDRAVEHINDLSKEAKEVVEFLENTSKKELENILINEKNAKNSITIDLDKFRSLQHIIKLNVIRIILANLVNTLKDVTRVNVDDVINLSMMQKGGHLDLPYNITVDKKQGKITFTKNDKNISMSRRKKK